MHKTRESIDAQQKATMRPIIFSTPMVQAILNGNKTMTRRIVKPQPAMDTEISYMPNEPIPWQGEWNPWKWDTEEGESVSKRCPYGNIGDRLWVRETVFPVVIEDYDGHGNEKHTFWYKADNIDEDLKNNYEDSRWIPSIYMPKVACRIFLEITKIKVQRVQDISEEDAIHEGVECMNGVFNGKPGFWYRNYHSKNEPPVRISTAIGSFQSLWEMINGEESWNTNPFVWAIEYRRIE